MHSTPLFLMLSHRLVAVGLAFLVTLLFVTLSPTLWAQETNREDVTITFTIRSDLPNREEYARAAIAEFMADNPDINVQFRGTISAGYPDTITTLMVAGQPPDVFELWGSFAIGWAESGALLDLTPYVDRDMNEMDILDFLPRDWQAGELQWGPRKGMRFGLPRYTNTNVLWYNIDMLEEAGLEDINTLDDRGGWDLHAFLEYVRRLTVINAETVTQWGFDSFRWVPWVYGFGGSIFDYGETLPRYKLDSAQSVAGLQFLNSLIFEHGVMPPRSGVARGFNQFTAGGTYAIIDDGTALAGIAEQSFIQGKFRWDIALGPRLPGGARPHGVAGDMYAVSSATKHPEAAWKFVKFLTSRRGGELLMSYQGYGLSRRSAVETYLQLDPERSLHNHFEAALQAKGVYHSEWAPNGRRVGSIINDAVNRSVFRNEHSVASAISQIRDQVEALLLE